MEMRVRNRTSQQQNERPLVRRGFTLVELLVAIVIISVLAAFLLPAINSSISSARVSAVRNEISQLEAAIANFKQKYGIDPPSYITLYEAPIGWTNDTTGSKAIIQRMWPNFDFAISRDINADYVRTGTFVLTGPECLVFFLGGCFMYGPGPDGAPGVVGTDDDGNTINDDAIEYFYSGSDDTVLLTPSGFSKNPTNPFLVVAGESTDGPFFEFSPSRLNKSKFAVDFFVYVDSIPSQSNPYVYLSSYEGKRYPTTNSASGVWLNTDSVGYMQRAYYQSIPDQFEAKSATPYKPKSFQIISPGQDFRYGVGGVYIPDQPFGGLNKNPKEDINNNGLLDPGEDLNSNGELDEPSSDYDNITNLAPGRLAP